MMFGVSVVVWLSVMSMATAGDTTPANTLPQSARKTILQEVRGMKQILTSHDERMKQMLTSKLQAAPSSYPVGASGSSKELWAIKIKLMALETKLEVSEANQKAMQANQKATRANQKAMQIKLEATQTKLEATQTKLDETKAKQDATEQELRSTRASLKTLKGNRKGGSTFIHWGRKTCSNASRLVYSGVAGGSLHVHPGAASNPLCLTMKPQFDGTRVPVAYALLYGAEYEHIPNHHDHDVPCSVCRAPHSTTIMIPATRACPKGWTTQYTGHLSAGRQVHKAASQYVCLDKDPEDANKGNQDHNGYLFYYTITQCGSLPCPPYANNQVVLCVVCSK